MIYLLIIYLASLIVCGTLAWVFRKEDIRNYGDATTAIICTVLPVINIIVILLYIKIKMDDSSFFDSFFGRPITWK